MSKSTQVHVVLDDAELKYVGYAGRGLLQQSVFYEKYDELHGEGSAREFIMKGNHTAVTASYDGVEEVSTLMRDFNLVATLMLCTGLHNTSYIISTIRSALNDMSKDYPSNISISFSVYC